HVLDAGVRPRPPGGGSLLHLAPAGAPGPCEGGGAGGDVRGPGQATVRGRTRVRGSWWRRPRSGRVAERLVGRDGGRALGVARAAERDGVAAAGTRGQRGVPAAPHRRIAPVRGRSGRGGARRGGARAMSSVGFVIHEGRPAAVAAAGALRASL